MAQTFKAIKVTDNVYWVGAIDWEIRNFHGYLTNRGTTYNAYLLVAEKVALIDTVKAPFFDEMMARIALVVPPEKIDYIPCSKRWAWQWLASLCALTTYRTRRH